jgi:hypothetical protein
MLFPVRTVSWKITGVPGRPFLVLPARHLAVAGDFLVTYSRAGLVFRTLTDGAPVHTFPTPDRSAHCEPFVDDDGPGVLTVEWAQVRLWRRDGVRWRALRLDRPGLRARLSPSRRPRRPVAVTAHAGQCLVQYADGAIMRYDARTGAPTGIDRPARPVPDGPAAALSAAFAGRSGAAYHVEGDQVAGASMHGFLSSSVTIEGARVVCTFTLAGRETLAVAAGPRLHRIDARTGAHFDVIETGQRGIRSLAAAVVDGRPVLFTTDGDTIRGWGAETGLPWPAPPAPPPKPAPG